MKGIILDNSLTTKKILLMEWNYPNWEWIFENDVNRVIQTIESEDIQILSTSQELGSINGLELIQRIRTKNLFQPIISLISSYVDKDFIEEAYKLGADLVITKSFKYGDLSICFERILNPSNSMDTILLIDDSEIVRKFVSRSIIKSEFQIREAESMESAMNILEKHSHRIVLVISDQNMEGGNGTDICYRIRKNPRLASIPFFLSSGEELEDLKDLAMSYWINGFFGKPIDIPELLDVARMFQKNWYSHRLKTKSLF